MAYKQHPLSAAYPAMQANEYRALLDSITEIGVQSPITLYEGQIIDGWHRYRAATDLGMECPTVELGDVDPRDFAKSQGARRNITASQNALAITAIYAWRPIGKPVSSNSAVTAELPKTTKQLAAIAGVGTRTIEQAKAVHAGGVQAVQDAVKTGAVSVETAAAVAKLPAKEQKKIAAQGPEAMRAAAKPAPVVEPESEAPPDDDGPSEEELAINAAAEAADRALMATLLDSDAPLAALAEENKQLKAEIAQLKLARDGYMNRCNEAIALVKARDRQIAKLEKMMKVAA